MNTQTNWIGYKFEYQLPSLNVDFKDFRYIHKHMTLIYKKNFYTLVD